MKYWRHVTTRTRVWMLAVMLGIAAAGWAQIDLTGRIYHNDNIMKESMDNAAKDMDKKVAEARTKTIAKQEKEKGRKLTAEETAEVDKKLQEAVKMAKNLEKAMKAKATVEFKSTKEAVMTMEMSVNENALKAAGMGWLKRKAMKAALAVAPKSQKVTYVVKGNLVITSDGRDKDTLRLSDDGKYLYGTFEQDMKFKLSRTQ